MSVDMTDHEKLKHELRLFLEFYITDRIKLILGTLEATDWG